MIVFLSFAPIEFMGGAEKVIYKFAKFMNQNEEVMIINADKAIADMYGAIILQRTFTDRMVLTDKQGLLPTMKITFVDFIPWSIGWKNLNQQLATARLIYIKYEILEVFLLFYFGGLKIRKKTIASLHSPLLYPSVQKFSDRLHTVVYSSRFNHMILQKMKKVHVLNVRDEKYLKETYHLENVIRVPNSLPSINSPISHAKKNFSKKLSILFVGELSLRKGADILITLIQKLPDNCYFSIAGEGPLRDRLLAECKEKRNWKYYGYVQGKALEDLYVKNDVLFAPSRAEGLSLVMLEALKYGLKIVGYDNILADFSHLAKSVSRNNVAEEYEIILRKALNKKIKNIDLNTKQKVKKYFFENFSDTKILPIIQQTIFA